MTITTKMWNDAQARITQLEQTALTLSKIIAYIYPRASLFVSDPVTEETDAEFKTLVESLPK